MLNNAIHVYNCERELRHIHVVIQTEPLIHTVFNVHDCSEFLQNNTTWCGEGQVLEIWGLKNFIVDITSHLLNPDTQ